MTRIIYTHVAYEDVEDEKNIFSMSKKTPALINAIIKLEKIKQKENIEVFERRDNIIATEEGYYFAFYESDLRHAKI